jgi:hypothetical protein
MGDLKDEILAHIGGDALVPFVAGLGFDVRPSGSEYKFLCPFHDDRRPSFTLNTRKKAAGIFKCFSCGWGGDVFEFVGALRGDSSFRGQLALIAEQLGLDTRGNRSKAPTEYDPEVRERIERAQAVTVETMTAREVLDVYRGHQQDALEADEWCRKLGVHPAAMEMIGGLVVENYDRTTLVVPMRSAEGVLTSLRYRCFETKKRWSVDVKSLVDGARRQTKCSTAGLMAHPDFFDPDICTDYMTTVVIEGETDILAALTMMIRDYGEEMSEWPARWVALPGVMSCHDILIASPLTDLVLLFFDDDDAGRAAVFDHHRKNAGPSEAASPGLITRLEDRTVRAAFPPQAPYVDGDSIVRPKYDLRDMVRDEWTWHRFLSHCIDTGTADRHGLRRKRETAARSRTA